MHLEVALQPKQGQILDLMDQSPASWIGLGGGRGCAKSYTVDSVSIMRRIERPGTVGCIVMRNYDQVRKYHIEPMLRSWPALEEYYAKSDSQIRIPVDDQGAFSQIDFSYAESLSDVERRFRSANYYDIAIDQAEQFTEEELLEIKKACRWPGVGGKCKVLLSFNMGGASIQTLRRWFHTREYNERQTPQDYAFVHVYPWDNVEWSRPALAEDNLTADDYYDWTDRQRMEYCATRSDYGKELNSQDDALRNRDWFGSWESLEGAYFGRVFDLQSTLVTQTQVMQLVKPWDVRWLSQDWGKSHFCSTHWHAKTLISPEDAQTVLGWNIDRPLNAAITTRELVLNETASQDIAQAIANKTPESERQQTRRYFLSPDAFGDRDSDNTIAMKQGLVLRKNGLPQPESADNDRVGGAMLMYNLLGATRQRGTASPDVWLISAECPELLNALPMLMRDQKNLDDVLKTDKGHAAISQDVYDSSRYGLKSMLSPRTAQVPVEVRAQQVWNQYQDPTSRAIAMRKFEHQEAQKTSTARRVRIGRG